jgi:lysophospholipase L1-like esterase
LLRTGLASLLFWPGLLACLPQAWHVRRTASRFAAAGGASHGLHGEGKPLHVLGLGDSIIAGVGLQQHDQGLVATVARELAARCGRAVSWSALGQSGEAAAGVQRLYRRQQPAPGQDLVLLSVGVNDITGLTSLRRWRRNLGSLVACLQNDSPQAVLVLIGLPPMQHFPVLPRPLRWVLGLRAAQLDRVAARLAGQAGNVCHVPLNFRPQPGQFAADGYHPSAESHAALATALVDALPPGCLQNWQAKFQNPSTAPT